MRDKPTLTQLHVSALDGDPQAWKMLVKRLEGVVWWSLGKLALSPEDRQDAFAATFARLFERLDTMREPEKLPGWLSRTATREGYAVSRRSARYVPSLTVQERADTAAFVEDRILDSELVRTVRDRFADLSPDCQEILRLFAIDPPLSYAQIATILNRPIGSIGPTRARCLAQLRAKLSPYLTGGDQ